MTKRPYQRWTTQDDQRLQELYPTLTNADIARIMSRHRCFIKDKAKELGLKKPAGFLSTFQKHHNAGGKKTRFGVNGRFVQPKIAPGTVVWMVYHADRGTPPEWYIYLGKGHPVALKRYIWEKHVGPIPRGHIVRYRDGNPKRCILANLECLSRRENLARNENRTKSSQTIQSGNAAASYYASRLFMKDKETRAFVLEHAPELVEAKRQQLMLKNKLQSV